jgi:sulfur relay (sulfurtransferase) DsrC/TusE family protein
MTAMTVSVGTDPEGYLIDPTDWTEDIARALAGRDVIRICHPRASGGP